MAAAAILNFKNCNFWSRDCNWVQYQNGSRPPSWILHICILCPVALVSMPFCFLVQNFAEIGQSVDDLWPKKRFSRWRPPPSWILKILIFGHVTTTGFNIWYSVPNFIKSGQFCTEIWRFNDVQNKKLQFLSSSACRHAVMLSRTKFRWNRTIDQWVMAKNAIFKMAAAAILNFKKFSFWSRDRHWVQYLL